MQLSHLFEKYTSQKPHNIANVVGITRANMRIRVDISYGEIGRFRKIITRHDCHNIMTSMLGVTIILLYSEDETNSIANDSRAYRWRVRDVIVTH